MFGNGSQIIRLSKVEKIRKNIVWAKSLYLEISFLQWMISDCLNLVCFQLVGGTLIKFENFTKAITIAHVCV